MLEIGEAVRLAIDLLWRFDARLLEIVTLSLKVSLSALAVALLVGLPLGAAMAALRFPGRSALAVAFNALMGLPPVVVGLLVYLMLSRSGPLGVLGLLYTPTAMIIAQAVLITPIAAALTRQVVADLNDEYDEYLRSLQLGPVQRLATLLADARAGLVTVALAGLGRAIAEVGAVMIVGGNIAHVTRVMTTAIALETSKGELALALALGMVLLVMALILNGLAQVLAGRR